jgi:hypothetical protein
MRWNGYGRQCLRVRPEVGARCGSSARWDLCGGRRVTGVPTATLVTFLAPFSPAAQSY